METSGGGLLSSPADLFTRGIGQESTGAPAHRQSPWPIGPSPRTTDPQPGGDGADSAGGGPSTAAVSGVPAATFSPRLGEGQFNASRPATFYPADTATSPPRLHPNTDYRPTSGKQDHFASVDDSLYHQYIYNFIHHQKIDPQVPRRCHPIDRPIHRRLSMTTKSIETKLKARL